MDRWKTLRIPLIGGLHKNLSPLEQGTNYTGSLIEAINFEPSQTSGYRRLSGFSKFDSAQVDGTAATILGTFIFNDFVIAMVGEDIYESSGSGWSAINGVNNRPSAGRYDADVYDFGSGAVIMMVDGVNVAAKWDGSTYTEITHASAPTSPSWVKEHKGHVFFAEGHTLYYSVPFDDEDFAAGSGAGTINVPADITGIFPWRDFLYVFGEDRIWKITGSSSSDFTLEAVTKNLGCVDGHTIQEIGGDLVFLSQDGIRTIRGTDRIDDIELGAISDPIRSLVKDIGKDFQTGNISSAALVAKGQYRLFTTKSTDDEETSQGYLGGLRSSPVSEGRDEWEWFEIKGIKAACADSGYISGVEKIVHGGYDGYVYVQESGNSFNGANVPASFSLPYIPFDDPSLRKVLQKLDIFAEVEGTSDIRINPVFDYEDSDVIQPPEISVSTTDTNFARYGEATYGTESYGSIPEVQTKFNLQGSCLNASFTFSSNDMNEPYTIKELVVRYALHGGR